MNSKRISRRKKSKAHSKLSHIAIFILFLLIIWGLYLYSQQKVSYVSNINSKVLLKQKLEAKDFEIPIMLSPRTEQIIHHTGHILSYNEQLRLPNWVAYELTRRETKGKEKRSNRFICDPIVKGVIATNSDYLYSGYDKGHMAPAADMKWNSIAMKESFYFSNICPQHPGLNRRKWKDLEYKIRDWTITDSAIIIICGPIINQKSKVIGKNRITVPQQFFKVILSPYNKSPKAIGFLFRNEQSVAPLSTYTVTVDSIETLTGMDFFSALPDEIENDIESHASNEEWEF